MTTTSDELRQLVMDAQAELLKKIASTAPSIQHATNVAALAEAYAWLKSPGNAHGS